MIHDTVVWMEGDVTPRQGIAHVCPGGMAAGNLIM